MSFVICDGCRVLNAEEAYACANCGVPLTSTISPDTPIVIASRYRLMSPIGRGGMGTIYKAHDSVLDELVALKIVRPELARSPEMARRLRSEIRLAHRVAHRNVCRIFEYGDAGDVQYISMEFVDGTDLRRVLHTGGPLRGRDGIALALQIATGLQAIHEAGVIHRDLKTSNVMLDDGGLAKVMDFGIAKEWRPDMESSTGGLMGTPEYMSPEQVLGEEIGFRTDLYSFGIVLFELITGDVPFRGPTPGATLVKHVYDTSPFEDRSRNLERHMPAAVVEVGRRCTARRPSDRFQSAAELIDALSALLGQSPPKRDAPAAEDASIPPFVRRDWRTLTLGSDVLTPITEPFFRRRRMRQGFRAFAWMAAAGIVGGGAYSAWRAGPVVDATIAMSPRERPAAATSLASVPPVRPPVAEVASQRLDPAPIQRRAVLRDPPAAAPPETKPAMPSIEVARAALTAAPIEREVAPGGREPGEVERWTAALRTGTDVERAEAALALAALGPAAAAAVPALSAALRDHDGHVRSCAAQALGTLGPSARDAAPWLADALADRDERARAAAAEALPRLGPLSPRTTAALLGALKDDSPRVRALVVYALGQSGEPAPDVTRALKKALRDDQTIVRRSAEMALSTLGSP